MVTSFYNKDPIYEFFCVALNITICQIKKQANVNLACFFMVYLIELSLKFKIYSAILIEWSPIRSKFEIASKNTAPL